MTSALFVAAAALYAAASAAYLAFVLGAREKAAAAARALLAAAFAVHLAEIGGLCLVGRHPVGNAREVLAFTSWILSGAFLLASLRARIAAVGAFVAPATLALLLGARLGSAPPVWSPGAARVLGEVHISLATVGVAAFALAAAASALYLAAERQIKRRTFGRLFRRAPALETLDSVVHRSVRIGFPIFTVGLLLGALWAARRGGAEGARPEWIASVTAWCAFAALLLARTTAGWRGRRAAILALVGFATSAAVLAIYLGRGPT